MAFFHHAIEVLLTWGPYGLLLLSVLDSIGLPIVGGVDGLLIAIATDRPSEAYFAAICAIVGSLAGSVILFFIARKGGDVLLSRYVSRGMGARLHLWFQRYGLITVFVPAISPLPLPMKVPVFCAGALRVRFTYFVFVLLTARVVRYFALAYLAQRYGHSSVQFLIKHGVLLGAVAAGIAIAVAVSLRLYQYHRVQLGQPE